MQLSTQSKQRGDLGRSNAEQMHLERCTRKVKYQDEEKAAECDHFGL